MNAFDKPRTQLRKKTKIVATLGPATASPAMIEKLIEAGVNVFRLNFSHGDHEGHEQMITWIKEKRKEMNKPIAILQDLSGPKIRIGKVPDGPIELKEGDEIILHTGIETQTGNKFPVTHAGFAQDVVVGHHLLLADGRLELQIDRIDSPKVYCTVLDGGMLSSGKGINYPDGTFDVPAVTEKDKRDLAFGLKHDVDYVALSFVKAAADVRVAREICQQAGKDVALIAKIEKHEAISNFMEILHNVDGVMVARGDLGVEIPLEQVPMVQKKIIKLANEHGKPVITATQMLLSMVEEPRPTRAEVTDISTAILDGSDAIMLSEETSVGKDPELAVKTMTRIAQETEKNLAFAYPMQAMPDGPAMDIARAIARSAVTLAENLNARFLICPSSSGFTARMISRFRPNAIIMALTPNTQAYYRLALLWGVVPRMLAEEKDMTQLMQEAIEIARNERFAQDGDTYVITAGFPFGEGGPTNLIKAGKIA